ncbi:MAG: iron-sulfur cluster carrier protein ApbC [Gammaproteobacteria bacterium]|nr:MAG: iron-sulfur cluster carrier protein ApbC [Gammaproteobacteria bacterium]
MSELTEQVVKDSLATFEHEILNQDLVKLSAVKSIEINYGAVAVDIKLGFPCKSIANELAADIVKHLQRSENIDQAEVTVSWNISAHKVQSAVAPIEGIKNIIAVASGKGGVGKSTTAVNLALALQAEGAAVGILDADIYGPSMPMMLGVSSERPNSKDNKTIEPVVAFGIKTMSIGYLIEDKQAMIWRGPMVSSALTQLLGDTQWGELDYLIIDLPPGTGDIQLTLAQKVPVTAALIVTTPQDIALIDAVKAIEMFEKVKIPSLGIVENMATHICSECGNIEAIFGEGGGEALASQYSIDLLGSLPLDLQIRLTTDAGKPSVAADPDGTIAQIYKQIARRLGAKLSLQGKDYRGDAAPILFREA